MGIKKRFKIKKQQRWSRRKARKKSAAQNAKVVAQQSTEGTSDISAQTKPPT